MQSDGQNNAEDLAQLAKGRLVNKLPQLKEALIGKEREFVALLWLTLNYIENKY